MSKKLRVRRSIQELQAEYNSGNEKPLEDLMRAWKGIKELPPDDPRSFFTLGGYHGEPFRGPGTVSSAYWGGYCNHGNILFPTWHRVYLLKLEEALQSIHGCKDVMMPYWDETSDDSLKDGIPMALTNKTFVLDGQTIDNPLRSFVFSRGITDKLSPISDADYSKPAGYQTVRYPLSGLVGTEADRKATQAHNDEYSDYETNVELLNKNIVAWLTSEIIVNGKPKPTNVNLKYEQCLNAPNYTVFSNTTSAKQWHDEGKGNVMSLESPHNSIHLAVGGFDLPGDPDDDSSPISGANGDMGENDTAGLDPIFFFHHCFVDLVFWLWQERNGFTDHLEVIADYPGTNSIDSQGPTPGMPPNTALTLESPLNPFKIGKGKKERAYTSLDCINIKKLGYSYSYSGSLRSTPQLRTLLEDQNSSSSTKTIRVSGLNRGSIRGSFLISAFVTIGGTRYRLGTDAILSRWNVQGCVNCQAHLETKAFFPLHHFQEELIQDDTYHVEVFTRDGLLEQYEPELGEQEVRTLAMAEPAPRKKRYNVEAR